jgi:hypothetical protein
MRIPAVLFALAASVAVPAEAAEPALADVVRTTLFDTCPLLVTGAIRLSDPATVHKLGLRRGPPDLERRLAHPVRGQPEMAGRAVGANFVALAVYPAGALCTVTFGGPELGRAHAAISARIAADPALYEPDQASSGRRDKLVYQAYRYRSNGGPSFVLMLASPAVSEPNPVVIASIGLIRD